MKKYSGLIFVLISFLLTCMWWFFQKPTGTTLSLRQYSELISSLALIAFAIINFISTRNRCVDFIFAGLDTAYIYHKYLSILGIVLIWLHNFTLKGGYGRPEAFVFMAFEPKGRPSGGMFFSAKQLGTLSLYLFTALVILFLILYKMEYEKWKLFHTIIIIPYALGVVHYYLSSSYSVFALTTFSLWMNLFNLIGVLSGIYSIFLYEFIAFRHKYKITNLREVAIDTLEITAAAIHNKLNYKPGQFAFLKVLNKSGLFPSHPFTISNYSSNEIQFSIKVLGDHTKILKDNNLKTGDILSLAGPNGRFDYKSGKKHQIWIAGGIGITPFRSFIQSQIPSDYTVDLFYAYNNKSEGAYTDEFEAINQSNLKVHLFNSSKTGFLGIQDFDKYITNKNEEYTIYFCGPKPMRKKLKKEFKKSNFKIKGFNYEHFQFK
ncbi:ferredoxin reductase family protein [Clostridium felsineum]|uniref:ferredoxin reductase family protein n=1 Tax=Clostridium felsineum TaxID=36839 RepID=UPI00098C449D|nr:ferric reductase-like transmembrane domain-containing protein [Clostridium felsineum]URZ18684.1 Dihydroorotate dehydrogenase B (NAD(+)), electron transfer subunit [Clostridium felsineum DSM 794]